MIEFEVLTDLAPVTETRIDTNFEAVKEWLTETLAPYESMVVTPDAIADAKRDRANIRKVADSIDSQRKTIKKMWLKPYDEYEAKCKELTGIVSRAVANIDGQIKSMENEVKEQKRQELENFFTENVGDLADYIRFADIYDPRWLNATFSADEARNIILGKLDDTAADLETLRGMDSPYESVMLAEYSKSRDLRKAMAEAKRLEAIQRAEEERRAREAESVLEQETEPVEEPVNAPPPTAPASPIRPMDYEEQPQPKTYALRFEVIGTIEELRALRAFFDDNDIVWKKL